MFGGLRKKLEEVTAQVNPWDGGKTASTVRAARSQAPPVQTVRNPNQQSVDWKLKNAKYGVFANNTEAQQKFTNDIKPSRFNPITAAADSYADANYKLANTIGKGFWETGDAVKQLPGALRGKDNGFKESADQSIVGGVSRFGQSVASAALSPVSNQLANRERQRAERLLTPAYENLYRAYGNDPRLGANQAQIEAGQTDYALRTDPLNRSNIGVNDSLGTTIRKVGAQGAEAGFDILTAPAMALATKQGVKAAIKAPTTSLIKPTVKSALLSGSGNAMYGLQQDGATPGQIAGQFAAGAAIGAALPVTTNLVSQAVRPALRKANLAPPTKLSPSDLAALSNFRRTMGTGALMDDATYYKAVQAAQKAGIDFRSADAIDEVLGAQRHYETQVQNRKQKLQDLEDKVVKPVYADEGKSKNTIPPEIKQINDFLQEFTNLRKQYGNDKEFFERVIMENQEAPGKIGDFARHLARRDATEGSIYNKNYLTEILDDELSPVNSKVDSTISKQAKLEDLKQTARKLERDTGQKGLYSNIAKNMRDMDIDQQIAYMSEGLTRARDNGAMAAARVGATPSPTAPSRKAIPPELETLAREARKYKSANEFVALPKTKSEQVKRINELLAIKPDTEIIAKQGNRNEVLRGIKSIKEDFVQIPTEQGLRTRKEYYVEYQDGTYRRVNNPVFSISDVQLTGSNTLSSKQQLTDLYNRATQPTKGATPFEQSLERAGLKPNDAPRGLGEDEFFQKFKPELTASRTDSQGLSKSSQGTPNQRSTGQDQEQLSKTPKETSQPQIPFSSGDNLLPDTLRVKKTTGLDKAFRSTRSIIERQGKSGKVLADKLQTSRDIEEVFQAEMLGRLKNVTKLKGKDFEDFIDAVEGNVKPKNEKIALAVNEWRTVAPEIRQRAIKAGVDVGDLGPTYYPHYVDYDKLFNNRNDLNVTINHMVKSGQATTPEEALELLSRARDVSRNRRMGNLEASRLVNVPIYDKSKNSLINYISGSSRRIAQAETFGPSDEIALKMLADIAREGGDTSAATDAFNIAVGAKRYGATAEKVSGTARNYISTTRLGLGAITNASQSVNTGIVTGHLRTMGAMLKQLDPKQRKFVESTGTVADSVIQGIKENTGFTGKVLGKITAPGFGKVEKFNRSVAAIAGRDYAQKLAKKGDVVTLRNKLGVTGKIGKELTEAQQIQAARKIVEKTQFKVDAQDLPGWVSSPAGKLVAQFRTFSYNQSKFFSNEILKPTAKGNFMPLARLLAALPVGYGIYETKRLLNNREETDADWRKGLEAFGSVGGAGLVLDIFKGIQPLNGKYLDSGRRVSMAVGTFGGPAASTAADVVGSVSDAIQPKNIPKDNPNLEGKAGIKKGAEYFDATQLSRFGMRQVPIVGTRLQNTFLPYKSKKDSEPKAKKGETVSSLDDKEAIKKAAFSSEKGKAYLALKDENQKKEWAKNDPEFRKLYEQEKAFDKAFGSKELMPDGLSEESTRVLDKASTLTEKARKDWEKNLSNKLAYEKAKFEKDDLEGNLDDENRKKREAYHAKLKYALDNGVKDPKKVDELFEEPEHKYNLKVEEWRTRQLDPDYKGSTEDFKDQEELYKLGVEKDFSKEAVSMYSMSEKRLHQYIKSKGGVSKQVWNELAALDKAMIKAGLQKYSKLDGGSGGNGKKSKGGFDWTKNLFDSVDSVSVTKSLRQILEEAMKG